MITIQRDAFDNKFHNFHSNASLTSPKFDIFSIETLEKILKYFLESLVILKPQFKATLGFVGSLHYFLEIFVMS